MEANITLEQLISALKQGNYSIKKSEAVSLKGIELEDLGDEDSQNLDWVEIYVGNLATVIDEFTVYFELKSINPRKVVISDTEFDAEKIIFYNKEDGGEVHAITDKGVIEIIKKNIKPKLLQN
jgi:hypothetical protein